MEQLEPHNRDDSKDSVKSYITKRVVAGILVAVVGLWIFNLVLGFFTGPPREKNPAALTAAHTAADTPLQKADPLDAHATPATSPGVASRPTETPAGEPPAAPKPPGVSFLEACIAPLDHELHHRWWGWRPNDILQVTDNVNKFQLGVLEVTRRTSVILAERISRTGATAAFDPNLENAMNSFMINADQYWFPSAESKYSEGLKDFQTFIEKLARRESTIYTRTDNLIPLLTAYEDLLGSSEENLVKAREDDGRPVSCFTADDYFFYAQGVAGAMQTILEGVAVDFAATVESRHGTQVLHKAIESCHHAVAIDPILITDASPSGILANHRANLAAPISHARFYLSVLIKTLST
jgi:hypothetical protein